MKREFLAPGQGLTPHAVTEALSLAGVQADMAVVERLSEHECMILFDWAMRESLSASDNGGVRRRERPFLADVVMSVPKDSSRPVEWGVRYTIAPAIGPSWHIAKGEQDAREVAAVMNDQKPGWNAAAVWRHAAQEAGPWHEGDPPAPPEQPGSVSHLRDAVRSMLSDAGQKGMTLSEVTRALEKQGHMMPSRERLGQLVEHQVRVGDVERVSFGHYRWIPWREVRRQDDYEEKLRGAVMALLMEAPEGLTTELLRVNLAAGGLNPDIHDLLRLLDADDCIGLAGPVGAADRWVWCCPPGEG